jgi:hypothetical protein
MNVTVIKAIFTLLFSTVLVTVIGAMFLAGTAPTLCMGGKFIVLSMLTTLLLLTVFYITFIWWG